MIKDLTDDKKMAELGRYYAITKAIRKAKEGIRDISVAVLNGRYNSDELDVYHTEIDKLFVELKEAVTALATISAYRQSLRPDEQDGVFSSPNREE